MSTVKTHVVIKTNKSTDDKSTLDARAARFKSLTSNPSGASPSAATTASSKLVDPETADKLAKRAARFADMNAAPAVSTTGKVSTSSSTNIISTSVVDAEKLAKRAARFADVPKVSPSTTTSKRK